MSEGELLIRDVVIEGRAPCELLVRSGRIAAIGNGLTTRGQVMEGCGGALIPGLHDHHIHLLAAAARFDSLDISGSDRPGAAQAAIITAVAARQPGVWLRVTGYHEHVCGVLDRSMLDQMAPLNPLRLEHQSGALWVLNSLALECLGVHDAPAALERDGQGLPTGNLWRGEAWLRDRLGVVPPDIGLLARQLAAFGVTGVTDTSPTTDYSAYSWLSHAHDSGALPQKLLLMSGALLDVPQATNVKLGPVKYLLDDNALPDLDEFGAAIARSHDAGRAVAIHCVAYGELAMALAALDLAGSRPGDRIEHGGLIAQESIQDLRRMGLCVVTQPSFIAERGDRYLKMIDHDQQSDLYRCASLISAGVRTVASSDAPYGNLDPWESMRAAVSRTTRAGALIGPDERVSPSTALDLFLTDPDRPGGARRRLIPGAPADLCLLSGPEPTRLEELQAGRVQATLISGQIVFQGGDGRGC
jgi:predicted amidohydrolase YtcJ